MTPTILVLLAGLFLTLSVPSNATMFLTNGGIFHTALSTAIVVPENWTYDGLSFEFTFAPTTNAQGCDEYATNFTMSDLVWVGEGGCSLYRKMKNCHRASCGAMAVSSLLTQPGWELSLFQWRHHHSSIPVVQVGRQDKHVVENALIDYHGALTAHFNSTDEPNEFLDKSYITYGLRITCSIILGLASCMWSFHIGARIMEAQTVFTPLIVDNILTYFGMLTAFLYTVMDPMMSQGILPHWLGIWFWLFPFVWLQTILFRETVKLTFVLRKTSLYGGFDKCLSINWQTTPWTFLFTLVMCASTLLCAISIGEVYYYNLEWLVAFWATYLLVSLLVLVTWGMVRYRSPKHTKTFRMYPYLTRIVVVLLLAIFLTDAFLFADSMGVGSAKHWMILHFVRYLFLSLIYFFKASYSFHLDVTDQVMVYTTPVPLSLVYPKKTGGRVRSLTPSPGGNQKNKRSRKGRSKKPNPVSYSTDTTPTNLSPIYTIE